MKFLRPERPSPVHSKENYVSEGPVLARRQFVSASAFAAVATAVASPATAAAPDPDMNGVSDGEVEDELTAHRRDYYRRARF